jgi:general secretion pathway protein K
MTPAPTPAAATTPRTRRDAVARTRSPARRAPPRERQRGIALILVLWLTILLTAIGASFAFGMRHEALSARNAVDVAMARTAADGAIERAVYELSRPRVADAWVADGSAHAWTDGAVALSVVAVDEAAKIDVNTAPDALLASALMQLGGADAATASQLVDAINDWKDPDDLKRPNGAEAPDYQAAGLKYGPANAPFETVGEVSRVLGMKQAMFARIAPSLTVYSRARGINPATASRDVLLALPNATPDAVDAFIAARADALAQKLPVPPFPPASGMSSGAVSTWRIRATASLADGVTFVREAVVRPSADMRRPLIVLAWLQGTGALPASGASAAASTPDSNARS